MAETRYAKSGDVHIAYQVVGNGPIDIVFVPGFVSDVEASWRSPSRVRFYRRLASFSRLTIFDKRGTGLSDWSLEIFTLGFDGPIRGIACAQAMVRAMRDLGISIRAGLHTGECELVGEDLAGITVHIGARIAALAGPDDVLVSEAIKDLAAGSALHFEDRGTHDLKGVEGRWRLFSVGEEIPG